MRIYGPNGTTLGSPASNTRRTSSTGFSLPDTPATPEETRSAAPPKAAGNIDALLAMQGVEDPTERRKRSVARGRGALDVLDDLKLGLLSGNLDTATMNRLRDAAANLKSSSGDPGLDAVLAEIELRVEVELAKAGHLHFCFPARSTPDESSRYRMALRVVAALRAQHVLQIVSAQSRNGVDGGR